MPRGLAHPRGGLVGFRVEIAGACMWQEGQGIPQESLGFEQLFLAGGQLLSVGIELA